MTNLSIEEARRVKWLRGRAKYGPAFVGDPLEHLDDELLDAMNYVEEAERQGCEVGALFNRLHHLCEYARTLPRLKPLPEVLVAGPPVFHVEEGLA